MQETAHGPTILVVEDEAANRRLLSMVLESQGYHVIAASDGAEALDIIEQHEPDVIVLDLLLPRVDGFEVIQALQARPTRIPIVTLTASGLRPPVGRNDVLAVLEKPCSTETLLGAIRDVLAGRACQHA